MKTVSALPVAWRAAVMMCALLLAGSELVKAGEPKPNDSPPVATLQDQRYGPHMRNVLDLYRPESERPLPVFVYFHGGGFVGGDKKDAAGLPIVRECFKAGIAVVSANYRFVGKRPGEAEATTYPAPMQDGARVVQFVRLKAHEWKLDASRVAVSGISAGACMAMWIALHDEMREPKSDDPVRRQSTRVSAAISYAGPTTLVPKEILKHVGGNPSIHPSIKPFFGVESLDELERPEKQRLATDASAISHVSKDDPPVYLFYLGKYSDAPLPPETNVGISIHHAMFGKILHEKCNELGVSCQFVCGESPRKQSELEFLQKVFASAK